MNKVLEYLITAKDKTEEAVNSAWGRVKSFASGVGTQLANIKAGLEMAWGVAQKFASIFGSAIKEAFKFEKVQSDFAGLLNSVDAAKAHIADLREFASKTPLTFDDLSKASKLLLSFGMSVDEVMPSCKMLGDIAMGDSQKFQGLSLVFAQVRSAGKLMGQDLLQMINQGFNPLTVIAKETGKSMSELKDMMADGSISFEMVAEAMRVATSDGGLFNNAMANAAQTGEGLMSTLEDKWTDVVRTFGDAFTDTAKGGLQTLIDTISELVNNGTIAEWAEGISKGLTSVVDKAKESAEAMLAIGKACNWLYEKLGISDLVHGANALVQGVANGIGNAIGGGSFVDGFTDAATEEVSKGYYGRMAASAGFFGQDAADVVNGEDAANRAADSARAQAAAMSARSSELNASARGVSQQKIEQAKSLAALVAEAETSERVKAEQKIATERDRLMKQTVKTYTDEISEWQKKNADAQSKLADAKSETERMWQYYEDPSKWAEYMQEQREKQFKRESAMARFEQDYQNMNSAGWGVNGLSDYDRMTVEMARALEKEAAADEYARTTAEKTAEAVAQLEKLNGQLENGRAE